MALAHHHQFFRSSFGCPSEPALGVEGAGGLALAVHIMRVASIWIIAMGLNINTGLLDCMVLVPLALVVAMIPISIGGWGST